MLKHSVNLCVPDLILELLPQVAPPSESGAPWGLLNCLS